MIEPTDTEADGDTKYRLTPKGACCAIAMRHGCSSEVGMSIWAGLEAFCMRNLRKDSPDASYAAIVFDGEGGEVIGIEIGE